MPVEDCLNNLLAQFDKPCPHEPLKNSTFENQMKRKNDKSETPRPLGKKIQDSETQKSPENEISRHIKNAYEIWRSGQNFSRPTFFEVTFETTNYRTCIFPCSLNRLLHNDN